MSFAAKFGYSKILKRLGINRGKQRWNPLATMLVDLMNRLMLMEFDSFEIVNGDARDETKTFHDELCPLILWEQF